MPALAAVARAMQRGTQQKHRAVQMLLGKSVDYIGVQAIDVAE